MVLDGLSGGSVVVWTRWVGGLHDASAVADCKMHRETGQERWRPFRGHIWNWNRGWRFTFYDLPRGHGGNGDATTDTTGVAPQRSTAITLNSTC
jgi:hypothetical protein